MSQQQNNQINILNDVSTWSRVPNKILVELIHKMALCIGNALSEAKAENLETAQLNIGLGTLSVEMTDMQCKFIPSKELRNIIKTSLTDKVDPLELELERSLVEKLKALCEEVL